MRATYFKMLAAFEQTASDKLLFDLVAELSQKILDEKISTTELNTKANMFGEQEKRSLQSICLLGVIHLTRDSEERLKQMVNILPYVQKVLSAARNLLEYTLVPFAQVHALDILKSNFVGSESELRLAEQEIEKVNKNDSIVIRDMINFARKTVPVDIPLDRQKWLDGAEF
jgi:ABC-type Fe3+/spermidine/putrescine transport system ATPase subunit